MKFADYSPPLAPSLDEQGDALQKGLGRAVQWALNGRLHSEPLKEACLLDQRFDVQVEDSRGDWLWGMILATGAADKFREPMLQALHELSNERSAGQLCEIARHYAQAGDQSFRRRLYNIVDQKPIADSPWLGEGEILELDGEHGFLFAAAVHGKILAGREWCCVDEALIDLAIERFGEERVNELLGLSMDEAVHRYWETWRRESSRKSQVSRESHRQRMTSIPVDHVLQEAQTADSYWFRGWGMHAHEADIQTVAQNLWSAREPKVISNLLRVFSARPLPVFDERMIELCRHADAEVRRRALRALEPNSHLLVREFALSELDRGVRDGAVVALFINNYWHGDETSILEALQLPDDASELHWLMMDVVKVLEKNPAADSSQLGVVSYFATPCENCRFHAVERLLDQKVLPDWLVEECRHDSSVDCRQRVVSADNEA